MNKNIKNLACTFAVIVLSAAASNLYAAVTVTATDIKKPKDLQGFVNKARKEQDKTLIIDGSQGEFKVDSIDIPSGITIKGVNDAVLNFESTVWLKGKLLEKVRQESIDILNNVDSEKKGEKQNIRYAELSNRNDYGERHIKSYGFGLEEVKDVILKDLKIFNSQYSGVYVNNSKNITCENVEVGNTMYQGFRVVGKSEKIRFIKCYSHDNWDKQCLGEEADGFFTGNDCMDVYLEDCLAEYNSDDGYDNCNSYGGTITFIRCVARYNGFSREQVAEDSFESLLNTQIASKNLPDRGAIDIGSDGTGFNCHDGSSVLSKLRDKTLKISDCNQPYIMENCIAYRNSGRGFSRYDSPRTIKITNTYAIENAYQSFALNTWEKYIDLFGEVEIVMKECYENYRTEKQSYNFYLKSKTLEKRAKWQLDIKTVHDDYNTAKEKTGVIWE